VQGANGDHERAFGRASADDLQRRRIHGDLEVLPTRDQLYAIRPARRARDPERVRPSGGMTRARDADDGVK